MLVALSLLLLVSQAWSFSAVVAPVASSTSVYDQLASTPLVRASNAQAVTLPSLWRSQTPLGLADETVVCAFLRHFG